MYVCKLVGFFHGSSSLTAHQLTNDLYAILSRHPLSCILYHIYLDSHQPTWLDSIAPSLPSKVINTLQIHLGAPWRPQLRKPRSGSRSALLPRLGPTSVSSPHPQTPSQKEGREGGDTGNGYMWMDRVDADMLWSLTQSPPPPTDPPTLTPDPNPKPPRGRAHVTGVRHTGSVALHSPTSIARHSAALYSTPATKIEVPIGVKSTMAPFTVLHTFFSPWGSHAMDGILQLGPGQNSSPAQLVWCSATLASFRARWMTQPAQP